MPCRHKGGVNVQLFSFLTLVLDGIGSHCHTPATLPPRKVSSYPLYRSVSRPQGQFGHSQRGENPLPPQGLKHQTVLLPFVMCYEDCTVLSLNAAVILIPLPVLLLSVQHVVHLVTTANSSTYGNECLGSIECMELLD
jgi:hypothetical protein